jgi:hypothetical protein
LLDEVDAIFGPKAKDHEGLRAILNVGNQRGTPVARCVGQKFELQEFEVFCPKALSGIGRFPDTVADRSVPIRMRRRAPSESVERFRLRKVKPVADELRRALEQWAERVRPTIGGAEPDVPESLSDRAADGWEPLLAIADLAGGSWPGRARAAAVALHCDEEAAEESLGVKLLADLRGEFGPDEAAFTEDLLERLNALVESPWGGFNDGRGIDARTLARMLRAFGLRPRTVRIREATAKGYTREALADCWSRYTPSSSE